MRRLRGPAAALRSLRAGPLGRRRRNRDPDRFTVQDLLVEALRGLGAKPLRLTMTSLGATVGIASLVVTIGMASTAARQIARQFDAVAATHAEVQPRLVEDPGSESGQRAETDIPWDAVQRVDRLVAVQSATLIADIPLPTGSVTAVSHDDPSAPTLSSPPAAAASADLLDTLHGHVVTGKMFDTGHDSRADRVVALGKDAATRLGVHRVDRQPSVFIAGVPFAVIGIIDGLQVRSDLDGAAIIPLGTARELFGLKAAGELHLQIRIGAGDIVAHQVPIALDPNAPEAFDVAAPPPASQLRRNVSADVNLVFLALGLLALLAGGLGIANVTLLSVTERTGEIGLRRALGATDGDIRAQFLLESAVTGLLGGLVGAALGVISVVVVALAQGWAPVVDPLLSTGCAVLGAIVGLAAGVAPAVRASRIEPAAALRGGT
jgi:putative ABC transport system permease protein